MSLLGSQVYANPSSPCWLGTAGGTVAGTTVFTGAVECDNVLRVASPLGLRLTAAPPNQVNIGGIVAPDAGGANLFLATNGTMYLGRNTAGNTANTTFTPSAPATNNDILAVGGTVSTKAGASITPQTIATNKSVAPIPNSPTVTNITNDTAFPTVPGAVYDVSIKGRVLLASGVADPDDQVQVVVNNLQNYPGMSWIYVQYPSATGSVGLFDIRTRIISDATMTSLTVGFSTILNGASTAVYNGTIFSFNATRVA